MRRTSLSAMMVPNQNSVVFRCKTTMWSCLSGTACSQVVAEPTHVLELAIVVHYLRISQRHLIDLCCKLSFFFLDLMSLEYSDTNQIWISGRYDGRNIPDICILFPACTTIVPISHELPVSATVVQDYLQKWTCHGSHPFPMISKNHPLCCLQQGSPHHPF